MSSGSGRFAWVREWRVERGLRDGGVTAVAAQSQRWSRLRWGRTTQPTPPSHRLGPSIGQVFRRPPPQEAAHADRADNAYTRRPSRQHTVNASEPPNRVREVQGGQ